MNPRGLSVVACAGLLGAAALSFAWPPRSAPAAPRPGPAAAALRPALTAEPRPAVAAPVVSGFQALPALLLKNEATRETRALKLYDAHGQVDEAAALQLDELLCDARRPKHRAQTRIDRRTLQLLFKAAYHFASYEVEIVSAYREPGRRREGPHGKGSAIDFRLTGVDASRLASYLRALPRTGVGVYTHPKTQYVHLDNRERSFHWLDASPPRRHWREKSIGSADLVERDRRYTPRADWPDGTTAAPSSTAAGAP